MGSIHAAMALLADGWAANVRIDIAAGRIAAIETGVAPRPGDDRHASLMPGLPNLHSHAFQRGMAGLTETRGASEDSFWTWRDLMYRFALTLTPEQMQAIAAQAYVEMLEGGFTRVGEFHYLHHDRDGRPYDDIAEMASQICAAATTTGIGLTLLPVFYAHANFGGLPPTDGQRRFVTSLDQYARLLDATERHVRSLAGANIGVAPHSLRAVTKAELAAVVTLAKERPIHIHIAEQTREVDDCLAWAGARPVAWLIDNAPVDKRWCLVHATHMYAAETTAVAEAGAVVGLCPVTEANLGDGIFDGAGFQAADGRFGIGTDSNVLIDAAGELRQLEYSQRLRFRARNVLAVAGGSTGRALCDRVLAGGALALGVVAPSIAVGAAADFVSLDADGGTVDPRAGDQQLDAWIFTKRPAINSVWVGGRKRVAGGRHEQRETIAARFQVVLREILIA